MENIYAVASYTYTWPGRLIKARAALKFWNPYPGAQYSHISLSRDQHLNNMMSFARKEIHNPFHSGLVKEDIREGLFQIHSSLNQIAVMEIPVMKEEYQQISDMMDFFWENREQYGFNFLGLMKMLLCGKGMESKNRYFCSQWVSTVLKECGIPLLEGVEPYNIRPFDIYGALSSNIVYEGSVERYLNEYLKSHFSSSNLSPKIKSLSRNVERQ